MLTKSLVLRCLAALTGFVAFPAVCTGQSLNPFSLSPFREKYFPEDTIIRNMGIRYVLDSTSPNQPASYEVRLYDKLGRLLSEGMRPGEKTGVSFVYRTSGDTTYRLRFSENGTEMLRMERFVYDRQGQILSYLDCANYYFSKDSYYVGFEQFEYDEQNRLSGRQNYFRTAYPGNVSDTARILPGGLQLHDVIYYQPYKELPDGRRLVVGRHGLGKPDACITDSFLYDRQNRLIYLNTATRTGLTSELIQWNVNEITEYRSHGDSLTETAYTTSCRSFAPNYGVCIEATQRDRHQTLTIFNPDKTPKMMVGFYGHGSLHILHRYRYGYY